MREDIEVYGELFSGINTRNQEYWNKNFAAIKEQPGHLGTFQALITWQLICFRKTQAREEGLLLVMLCSTAWQVLRDLVGIDGDERNWLREKYKDFPTTIFDENWQSSVLFLENMHRIYEIQTFLRHPSKKLDGYSWVFHEKWPDDIIALVDESASILRGILNLAYNEFSLMSGWESEWQEKRVLHDNAMAANGA